jgi:hypothetical protein
MRNATVGLAFYGRAIRTGGGVMKTERYPHKIAAIYSDAEHAEGAVRALRQAELDGVEITRLAPDSHAPGSAVEPEQAETRNRFIVDMLVGGGIGTAAGAAGAGAMAIALPSVFVSVPVVGPLVVAGYGAILGATAGALKAFKVKEGLLADMVKDSLDKGFHVLIVHSHDAGTHERAERIVGETFAEDTATA